MVDGVERYETDSYLVAEWPTLLRVDNELSMPAQKTIRFLVSSADVLHNWAIPSAGIKVDACPGRLNAVTAYFYGAGTYFGMCSELCGVGHSAMPVVLSAEAEFLATKLNFLESCELGRSDDARIDFDWNVPPPIPHDPLGYTE